MYILGKRLGGRIEREERVSEGNEGRKHRAREKGQYVKNIKEWSGRRTMREEKNKLRDDRGIQGKEKERKELYTPVILFSQPYHHHPFPFSLSILD